MPEAPLLCSFESRRSNEMRGLIEKFGGQAFVAPSMQEVPLTDNSEAVAAIRTIVDGGIDAMVLLTGVGTDAMMAIASDHGLAKMLLVKMSEMPLLIRGPKPATALSRLGLKYSLKAPEPNTWVELVEAIRESEIDLSRQTVAVQEYGVSNPKLVRSLEEMGASVVRVPVYRWTMPDDIEPMKRAIRKCVAGDFAALLFTSAQQIRHVLEVAESIDESAAFVAAARRLLVASIGPTCTEALVECGLTVDYEASPPKMGPFVRGTVSALRR